MPRTVEKNDISSCRSNESIEKRKQNAVVAVNIVAVEWRVELIVIVVVILVVVVVISVRRSAHLGERRGACSLRLDGRHALAS